MQKVMADLQPGLGTLSIVGTLTLTKTGTTARTVTFPDAAITVARTDAAQTFTGTQTVRVSASQDSIAIAGRAGGTSSYVATITPPALSASITITLPAVSATLATLGTNTFTGEQVFNDQITTEAIIRKTRSVTSAAGTTILDWTDYFVVVTGTSTQTLTLPICQTGRELSIKNRSTGSVTVDRTGSDTIDGGTVIYLAPNDAITLRGNGTDWSIV